jgi:hypothetical protein
VIREDSKRIEAIVEVIRERPSARTSAEAINGNQKQSAAVSVRGDRLLNRLPNPRTLLVRAFIV